MDSYAVRLAHGAYGARVPSRQLSEKSWYPDFTRHGSRELWRVIFRIFTLMKTFTQISIISLLCFFSIAIILSFVSCGPKKDKNEITTSQEIPGSDTINQMSVKDTQISTTQQVEQSPKEEAPKYNPHIPKTCDPNFNLIGSPKKNQKIFYVSGFNPGEFKCWEGLVKHGQDICAGNPCLIYFVDIPNMHTTLTPPHYLDPNDLKTHGIGRFEDNGAWWEIKGSSMWGRKEKGYAYYNTNNAGGG